LRRRLGLRCRSGSGLDNATMRCSIGLRVTARRKARLAVLKACQGMGMGLAVGRGEELRERFASSESCAVDFAAMGGGRQDRWRGSGRYGSRRWFAGSLE